MAGRRHDDPTDRYYAVDEPTIRELCAAYADRHPDDYLVSWPSTA